MEAFFPRPADALKPYANGWLGGTPYGQLDVVNVDDALTVGQLRPYRVIAFGGWNTMTPKIASTLQAYAREGGEVILCAPQLSGRVDRDFRRFANAELVQAVPGVKVGAPKPVEDILMVRSCAPAFLKAAYPAHLGATMAVCAAELGPDVETLATNGKGAVSRESKGRQRRDVAFARVALSGRPCRRRGLPVVPERASRILEDPPDGSCERRFRPPPFRPRTWLRQLGRLRTDGLSAEHGLHITAHGYLQGTRAGASSQGTSCHNRIR